MFFPAEDMPFPNKLIKEQTDSNEFRAYKLTLIISFISKKGDVYT